MRTDRCAAAELMCCQIMHSMWADVEPCPALRADKVAGAEVVCCLRMSIFRV